MASNAKSSGIDVKIPGANDVRFVAKGKHVDVIMPSGSDVRITRTSARAWETSSTDPVPENLIPLWDTVIVNGVRLPGVCKISGQGVEHDIDIQKMPGLDGVYFYDFGRAVAKFEIELTLCCQKDWEDFEKIVPILQPLNATGSLGTFNIQNPRINVIGIRRVYITRVGIPENGSTVGTITVKMSCMEYRTPTQGNPAGKKLRPEFFENGGNGFVPPGAAKKPSSGGTAP